MISEENVGKQLLNIPFGQMVYQVAASIAHSQAELDRESINIMRTMGDKDKSPVYLPHMEYKNGEFQDSEIKTSMIGAGFQPTFYQFADTVIEVKMAISINRANDLEETMSGKKTVTTTQDASILWGLISNKKTEIVSTPIDATYTSKYGFNQEGSSMLRTRLVPVPPNPTMQRIMDLRAQAMELDFSLEMKKLEAKIAIEAVKAGKLAAAEAAAAEVAAAEVIKSSTMTSATTTSETIEAD